MKPSRELDTLVAEKVMEHKIFHDHGYSFITSGREAFDKMIARDSMFWEGTKDKSEYCWQLPAYSTDIAAAWAVVKEMATRGWRLTLEAMMLHRKEIRAYTVEFERWVGDDLEMVSISEIKTAPMAICLTALKAVEEENRNETK